MRNFISFFFFKRPITHFIMDKEFIILIGKLGDGHTSASLSNIVTSGCDKNCDVI